MQEGVVVPSLLATSWTSAGNARPEVDGGRSPLALTDRVTALSEAGWKGIGLLYADVAAYLQNSNSLTSLGALLKDNGIERLELEFVTDWWAEGERRRASDEVKRMLFEAAAELDVPHIKVLPNFSGDGVNKAEFYRSFAALADEAASFGTKIAIENLPFATHMQTLRETLDLVQAVDHPAAGLVLDIWHLRRTGTTDDAISTIRADKIFIVELDDAAKQPTGRLYDDTMDRRLLPGDGHLDVPGFINAIETAGYEGYWGVEIISDAHRQRPLRGAVASAFESTMRCFEEARARHVAGSTDTPGKLV
ncbi:sugar phosphate isomerase/epimerase family protein [Arthrobacter globiformis]|uniref:sugar phosphate isomerase/epimerase family protein n=1 Tax=Arthrobacter globiformis TaxID=1665 RepID=UPI0027D888AD|nr:sugar phosphate isomerase/epimerase family protein [Arthrobacter globiformis]